MTADLTPQTYPLWGAWTAHEQDGGAVIASGRVIAWERLGGEGAAPPELRPYVHAEGEVFRLGDLAEDLDLFADEPAALAEVRRRSERRAAPWDAR